MTAGDRRTDGREAGLFPVWCNMAAIGQPCPSHCLQMGSVTCFSLGCPCILALYSIWSCFSLLRVASSKKHLIEHGVFSLSAGKRFFSHSDAPSLFDSFHPPHPRLRSSLRMKINCWLGLWSEPDLSRSSRSDRAASLTSRLWEETLSNFSVFPPFLPVRFEAWSRFFFSTFFGCW